MKVAWDVVNARRERVATLLRQQRYLPLNDLCRRFSVSAATARRDLTALARDRKIQRTYGGALGDFNLQFTSVRERRRQAPAAKKRIAAAARQHMRPHQVCYLDAGTTIEALAEALAQAPPIPLTIVTNNLMVAERLSAVEGFQVYLLGGQLLPRQSVLLGEKALAALAGWKFDCSFLGAEGMNARGIWNSQRDIVHFQWEVLRRSRQSFFCLDRTKLQRAAPCLLVSWKKAPHLITDATPRDCQQTPIRLSPSHLILV